MEETECKETALDVAGNDFQCTMRCGPSQLSWGTVLNGRAGGADLNEFYLRNLSIANTSVDHHGSHSLFVPPNILVTVARGASVFVGVVDYEAHTVFYGEPVMLPFNTTKLSGWTHRDRGGPVQVGENQLEFFTEIP